MKFYELAQTFFIIHKESSRTKITQILADLLYKATAHEAQYISYLALGTLKAPYYNIQFNFAQKSIIKVLANLFNQDVDAYTKQIKRVADIGVMLEQSEWPYENQGLSIEQVYTYLNRLQEISGSGSQEEKSDLLAELLKKVDKFSAAYIIRIILGTMRLGFSDMTFIDALSWMLVGNKSLHDNIENAFNVCADMGLITLHIKQEGIKTFEHIKPLLGIPIRPAAAERLDSATAIINKIGPCVAQPKLDGFRLQIHIDKTNKKPKIWFFSRNLIDMSHMFPDLAVPLENLPIENIIMEGEAIVYDEETQSFVPFQETVKRKRKHDIEQIAQDLPLHLFIFDILFINNQVLLNFSHEMRRKKLLEVFKNTSEKKIRVIEEKYCPNAQVLQAYFLEQIAKGLEGVVVKRPDAPYRPGKRNFNWIKLKRHEEGHLEDTIDAVILGYNKGRGKRNSFGIGALLVGVYHKDKDVFETVAKIGTGLKDQEWRDIKVALDQYAVSEKPNNVICAPELEPDVWVTPKIVVVVRADEITQSPLHSAGKNGHEMGLALRFPRFISYAPDKTAQQATTVKELLELYSLQFSHKKN